MREMIQEVLAAAQRAGATFADLRYSHGSGTSILVQDGRADKIATGSSRGAGVRVLVDGAWGFAATSQVLPAEAAKVAKRACEMARANAKVLEQKTVLADNPAHVDVWQTPLIKDPFKIPVADKAELLLAVCEALRKVKGV